MAKSMQPGLLGLIITQVSQAGAGAGKFQWVGSTTLARLGYNPLYNYKKVWTHGQKLANKLSARFILSHSYLFNLNSSC